MKVMWVCCNALGRGSKRTISISNIRKITASKKNRREKGIRADFVGSKPHSNGEVFSRSLLARRFRNQEREKRALLIISDIVISMSEGIILLRDKSHLRVKSLMLIKAFKRGIGFI